MPEPIDRLFARALTLHKAGRFLEAAEAYRGVLEQQASHADALQFLGVLAHQEGRHEEAVSFIKRAIAIDPKVASYHNNLGNAEQARGALEAAERAYRAALARKPDYAEAQYNLGLTLHALGRLQEASDSLNRAAALRPGHAQTHFALGNLAQQRGEAESALAAYERALALRPDFAAALINRGNVLVMLGRTEAAMAAYGGALELAPASAEVHLNLGLMLLKLGRVEQSIEACLRATELNSADAQAHCTLGHALREAGRGEEASDAYRRALELAPQCAEAKLGSLLAVLPLVAAQPTQREEALRRFTDGLAELRHWSAAQPQQLGRCAGMLQPFHLAYGHADVTRTLCEYGELVSQQARQFWQVPERAIAATAARSHARKRVLIISGQVRQHPVWEVITRGIVQHLDRGRFELSIHHTGAMTDEQTEWARAQVGRFEQGAKPMSRWLQLIAEERPDVILFPEVGMDPTAGALASLRLAPLQVAAWGHPVTTGLPSIDLYLSGELLESTDAERHYCERLIRLPGTGVCTEWPTVHSERWEGPARAAGVVRFALCQQPIKFDPVDDAVLARIARLAGPCEFWLADPENLPWAGPRLRARLAAALRREGLDPQAHLRSLGWRTRGRFSGFLEAMDLYLDCPAFSGYTTAWQALHHGLPVVTREGPFLRQRLAAGLLRQIGVTEGLTQSSEEYVRTAVRWAQEVRHDERWRERRVALRAAAEHADGNLTSIAALETVLLDTLASASSESR